MHALPRTLAALALTIAVLSPVAYATRAARGPVAAPLTGSVILTDTAFNCTGPVALDLLKVTMNPGLGNAPAVLIGKNCTGTIARIEVDTWDADGVKVQNADPVAHDLTISGGYVTCHDKAPTLHQDGVQAMGGTNILFQGTAAEPFTISCGRADATLVDSDFFVNKAGSGAGTPTDVICDTCTLGPGPAAHEANIGESLRSGLRNSVLCPDKTHFNGAYDLTGGAVDPVNDNNVQPATC